MERSQWRWKVYCGSVRKDICVQSLPIDSVVFERLEHSLKRAIIREFRMPSGTKLKIPRVDMNFIFLTVGFRVNIC